MLHQLPRSDQGGTHKSMFSTIPTSSASSLSSYNAPSDSESSLLVDQQIQAELEQAAERGMVSTRSQDSTPAASQPSQVLYPQVVVIEKKRKIGHEGEDSPVQAVKKRRRRSAKPNGDTAPSSSTNKADRMRGKASTKTANGDAAHTIDHSDSDHDSSTQGSGSTSLQTPAVTTNQKFDNGQEEEAVDTTMNEVDNIQGSDHGLLHAQDQVQPDAEGVVRLRRGRESKKRRKGSERLAGVDENGADTRMPGKKPGTSIATASEATHKRFGSGDIEVPDMVSSNSIEERKGGRQVVFDDEVESGDEGPETVTASAGFDKARTSALEAAKVAAKQKAEKKLKRREHDERLRLQAHSAKDSRSKGKPSTKIRRPKGSSDEVTEADGQMHVEELESSTKSPNGIRDEERKRPAKPKHSGKIPLPILLPEEILSAAPVVHAPISPFTNNKAAISQKRKFLDLESKPPKDMKRGNITVHVLEDNRSLLPPKSSQASKALRESWLTGRQHFNGVNRVPRRKPSGGFVRRK